jgi:TonB family protein
MNSPGRARAHRVWRVRNAGYIVLLAATACTQGESTQKLPQVLQARAPHPDEFPKVLNTELPFHYPAALYARRVQGNVTLRLHIDQNGQVRADSTRVEESSGHPALDSAALKGSQELRFVPAKLRGEPLSATVLFPVYFRHPEARALPGDSILNKPANAP